MSTNNSTSEHTTIDSSEIVSASRRLLENLPTTDALPETEKAYRVELSRLIKKTRSPDQSESPDRFWAAICNTRSKSTYYRRIAAVKFGLRFMLEGSLRAEKIESLRFLLGLAKKLEETQGTCPITNAKRRHSKRQDIRGLAPEWREAMFSEMQKTIHRIPFLVLSVAGCRPEELKKGVRVVATRNALTLHIQGAKVKETQGQPNRRVAYDIDPNAHPLVQALHREIWCEHTIDEATREVEVRIENKDGFSSAIRRAGRRLWSRRKITPSCFRHAAASDYKDHLKSDQVSAAIGHCVDATKSRYGQRQMAGNDGLHPSSVQADRPIKPTARALPGSKTKAKPRY